mgnify:CR=1 FL=1
MSTAIAAERAQGISCQTFRMNADKRGWLGGDVAKGERKMVFSRGGVVKGDGFKVAKLSR